MNRGVYTAATGMTAQQQRLDIVANNLANVNTRGYKAERVAFGEALGRAMATDGGTGESLGTLSSGAKITSESIDFAQGAAEITGNPLDLAIQGDGMFAVAAKGGTAYTRDGAFRVDARNTLVTKSGDAVLDTNGKPIVLPAGTVTIDANGAIRPTGGTETLATLALARGTFKKANQGGNLFSSTDAKTVDGRGAFASGQLESANVEPVSAMIEMISIQRSYEMSQKMVQSQDEATGKLTEAMA